MVLSSDPSRVASQQSRPLRRPRHASVGLAPVLRRSKAPPFTRTPGSLPWTPTLCPDNARFGCDGEAEAAGPVSLRTVRPAAAGRLLQRPVGREPRGVRSGSPAQRRALGVCGRCTASWPGRRLWGLVGECGPAGASRLGRVVAVAVSVAASRLRGDRLEQRLAKWTRRTSAV